MNYQQFDEKLQNLYEMTPKRERKLRERWKKISQRGPVFFTLTRGLLLAAWMLFCFAIFTLAFHARYALMANQWAIVSIFVSILCMSLPLPLVSYRVTRKAVETLDLRAAQRERRLRHRPSFSPSRAPETAP